MTKKEAVPSLPPVRMVRLDDLRVDLESDGGYQRQLVESRVRSIVENFLPDAVGCGIAASRKGVLYNVDSQTRAEALRRLGYTAMPMSVFKSEGRQHEAAVFMVTNGRRSSIPAWVQFRASCIAADPVALGVVTLAKRHGLQLTYSGGDWPRVCCVRSMLREFRRDGGKCLNATFKVICDAWRGDAMALTSPVVSGVAKFLATHKDVDHVQLVNKLCRVAPVTVVRNASAVGLASGGQGRVKAIADSIARIYKARVRQKVGA